MRGLVRTTSLWPGLAELWLRGSVWGLSTASAFALALNFALLATFAPERVRPDSSSGWGLWGAVLGWVFVLGFWIVGVRSGLRTATRSNEARETIDPEQNARFSAAQHEYLRGHWIEAETLLAQVLAGHPEDCEATLLLASVERRSGRPNDARRTLVSLERQPMAIRWRREIERELALLDAAVTDSPLSTRSMSMEADATVHSTDAPHSNRCEPKQNDRNQPMSDEEWSRTPAQDSRSLRRAA